MLGTIALAVALLAGCGGGGGGEPTVRLALDFTPNAAHAGIFAAVDDRRDRAHGIHLEVRQPSASTDSLELLTTRRADLAVLDIHDLGLARERGEDPVGVGALVQRPLAALEDGTRAALRNPDSAVASVARAAQADRGLVRSELRAIAPALSPPLRLSPRALRGWATFDVRFGILPSPPDIGRAFDLSVAP